RVRFTLSLIWILTSNQALQAMASTQKWLDCMTWVARVVPLQNGKMPSYYVREQLASYDNWRVEGGAVHETEYEKFQRIWKYTYGQNHFVVERTKGKLEIDGTPLKHFLVGVINTIIMFLTLLQAATEDENCQDKWTAETLRR